MKVSRKHRKKTYELRLRKYFLNTTLKSQIDKWNLVKF